DLLLALTAGRNQFVVLGTDRREQLELARKHARDQDRDGGGHRAIVQHGLIDIEAEVAAEVVNTLGEYLLADQGEAAATASDIFSLSVYLRPPALFEQDVGNRRFEERL